jgi:hypothetical protein
MLPPRHQALVDDLGGVVAARVDVDALLDDRVRARAEHLADLVPAGLNLRRCPVAGCCGGAHGEGALAVNGTIAECFCSCPMCWKKRRWALGTGEKSGHNTAQQAANRIDISR